MKVANRCRTYQNFCEQIQSTPEFLGDPSKHVDGPTEFFLIGKFSFPIFSSTYFFPANFFKHIKSSPEKNQADKFFPRKKSSMYKVWAKKNEHIKNTGEKNDTDKKR